MFIVYFLLAIMGLIIANFVVTYFLFTANSDEIDEKVSQHKIMISDLRKLILDNVDGINARIEKIELAKKSKKRNNNFPKVDTSEAKK